MSVYVVVTVEVDVLVEVLVEVFTGVLVNVSVGVFTITCVFVAVGTAAPGHVWQPVITRSSIHKSTGSVPAAALNPVVNITAFAFASTVG